MFPGYKMVFHGSDHAFYRADFEKKYESLAGRRWKPIDSLKQELAPSDDAWIDHMEGGFIVLHNFIVGYLEIYLLVKED